MGKDHVLRRAGEEPIVVTRTLLPQLVPLRQMPELHAQKPCLDRVESTVVPLDVVDVLRRLAVVAQHLAMSCYMLVVRRDGAGLTARAQVLAGIEAEGC